MGEWTWEPIPVGSIQVTPAATPITILGVIIDPLLNFRAHSDQSRMHEALSALETLAPYLHPHNARQLYEAKVLTMVMFGALAWYNRVCASELDRLEALHAWGCRILTQTVRTLRTPNAVAEAGPAVSDSSSSKRHSRSVHEDWMLVSLPQTDCSSPTATSSYSASPPPAGRRSSTTSQSWNTCLGR